MTKPSSGQTRPMHNPATAKAESPPVEPVYANKFPWSLLITSMLLSIGSVALVSSTSIPLGIPEQWVWERLQSGPAWLWSFFIATAICALFLCAVWIGERFFFKSPEPSPGPTPDRSGILPVSLLVIISFFFLLSLRSCIPGIDGLARGPWILYYPRMSGYFTQARTSQLSTTQFLSSYDETMRQGDYLHQGTHPPGLVLFYRGLLTICQSQIIQDILMSVEPTNVTQALDLLKEQSTLRNAQGELVLPELTPTDRAVLWLADLLTTFLCAATLWPLWGLLRISFTPQTAWRTLAFWPLIPSLALFLPKSDGIYPCLSALILYAGITIYSQTRPTGIVVRAVLTGALLCLGFLLTLAFIPIAVMLAGFSAIHLRNLSSYKQHALAIAGLIAGFCMIPLFLASVYNTNLVEIWILNYQNHGRFYDHATRHYLPWLFVNLIEFIIAVGTTTATIAIFGLFKHPRNNAWLNATIMASVLLLLWISGKNMGELARLWIIFYPCTIVISGLGWQSIAKRYPSKSGSLWLTLLIMQAIVTIFLITSVTGFHMGDL